MYRVEVEDKQAPFFLKWCRENIASAHYPERDRDKGFLAGKFPRWSDRQLGWLGLIVFRIAIATGKEVPRYSEARKFSDEIGKKLGSSQADEVPAERLREKSDKPKKPRKEVADKWNLYGRDKRNKRLALTKADLNLWYEMLELKWDQPYIEVSISKLARITGLEPRTVERSVKRLYERGFFDKSGSSKGGRNQTMRYSYMMPLGRYRYGLASPEEVKVIESGINPVTEKPFSEWIRAFSNTDRAVGVTDENPDRAVGVTGAKPRPPGRSIPRTPFYQRAIVQKAVASGAARARQPVELSPPFERGVATGGRDLEREPKREERWIDDPERWEEPNQEGDPGQQGTSPPDMQEDVSWQPAAARPVPRSTAPPSAPRRRSGRDLKDWELFHDRLFSEMDAECLDTEEYEKVDWRFCYDRLAKKYKMTEVAATISFDKWYSRASLKPFPGTERALSDLQAWLRGEERKDLR